ncbi:hypothetical protein ANAEL_05453 [Anaerolineales bacterium]|nr:hypothetical protein ANAEL_05453 [Anaerolineales bacterium]
MKREKYLLPLLSKARTESEPGNGYTMYAIKITNELIV